MSPNLGQSSVRDFKCSIIPMLLCYWRSIARDVTWARECSWPERFDFEVNIQMELVGKSILLETLRTNRLICTLAYLYAACTWILATLLLLLLVDAFPVNPPGCCGRSCKQMRTLVIPYQRPVIWAQ